MNLKLSNWASIAEIGSGIAVVVTLIFLVVGIRENTNVTRASVYASSIDSVNQWRLEIVKDPALVRRFGIFTGALDEGATDAEVEQFQFYVMLNAQWGIYEKAYYANQYGIMGPSEWSRFESRMCSNREDAVESGLWERMDNLLTDEFDEYVVVLCAEQGTNR